MTALADNSDENILTEETLIKGIIIKNTSSKFFVQSDDQVFELASRGALKYKNGRLLVGDEVEFSSGVITSVYPRRSEFSRPGVANIDYINVVISSPPKPDYLLIDKIIVSAFYGGAKVVITVNKTDVSDETYDYVLKNYSNVAEKIFNVSALSGKGIDELKSGMRGKLCAFLGQSAVGKTSLVNALFDFNKRVGEISVKTQRGKHTTTASEIHFEDGCAVVDTPGFSAMFCDVSSRDLSKYYPEFNFYSDTCYYIGCRHISEPDCAVKIALDEGKISSDRYNRYVEIYKTVLNEEKYGRR